MNFKSKLLVAVSALSLYACASPQQPATGTAGDKVTTQQAAADSGKAKVEPKAKAEPKPKAEAKAPAASPTAADKAADKAARDAQKAADKAAAAERKAAEKAARDAERAAKKAQAARLKGPYEPDVAAFVANASPGLEGKYRALFVEGERNAVLNFNRLGLLELQGGNMDRAKWAFDHALSRIELIYANDPGAKAAKSIWTAEAIKDYKGEPYERSMAYYYRGLIDLYSGDFQNARASFKEGEYQDTVSEAEEFEGDFAALSYLSGWASHCDGDSVLAEEYFGYASKANPELAKPEPDHNLLLVMETGTGPTKYGDGQYREYLKFSSGSDDVMSAPDFAIATGASDPMIVASKKATDVSFQATTRGGRPFQAILNGKADFKETATAVGQVATTAGTAMMTAGAFGNNNDLAGAGAVVALFGLMASAAAQAATPAADIRYWDNLPNGIMFGTAKVPAAAIKASVSAAESENQEMRLGGNEKCQVAWLKDSGSASIADSAPNSTLNERRTKAMLEKDARFREQLLSELATATPASDQASTPGSN